MLTSKKIRKFNIAIHRDFGYFFSSLIIVYCLSGIALNHVDDWNPDFIITKEMINVEEKFTKESITTEAVIAFGQMVGEEKFKIYDFPTHDQVKIYYNNASLHINFTKGEGVYETVSRRPLFYHSNIIHRNNAKGWKWASDVFAILLVIITVTGLFILRGKQGISGRGKWLIAAGALPPFVALLINELI
ncbi:MAG: PepSY-associated TM helix domain-containing protein [Bacteroidales bacterium]|nr:PepSY-associated TM helix domain-containing protein [Bacteroidales bacterium]